MDNKTDLRIRAKSIRKTLDIAQRSCVAVSKIRNLDIYNKSFNILIYYPKKFEINLLGLVNSDKNFYLPKVNGENLFVCPFKVSDNLIKSDFKIEEPCSNPVKPDIIDLVIVPALMADKQGFRLGYGGGFYDRFLAQNPNMYTIVPVFEELFVEELPREEFDKKINFIITC